MKPSIAILIPNFNGAELLPRCVESIRGQSAVAAEAVVIDNGSTDDSKAASRGAKWLEGSREWGFARAINEGVRQTDSEWVLLFNNDAWLASDWGEAVARAVRKQPDARMFASVGISGRDESLYYSLGDIFHHAIVYRAGHLQRRDLLPLDDLPGEVAGPSGYCGLHHRSLFDRLGLLEESFGSYFEDADFNMRCLRAGHRCPLVKDAFVFHLGAATGATRAAKWSFMSGRNGVWFVRRHFGLWTAPFAAYQVLRHYVARTSWYALRGYPEHRARLKGVVTASFSRVPPVPAQEALQLSRHEWIARSKLIWNQWRPFMARRAT